MDISSDYVGMIKVLFFAASFSSFSSAKADAPAIDPLPVPLSSYSEFADQKAVEAWAESAYNHPTHGSGYHEQILTWLDHKVIVITATEGSGVTRDSITMFYETHSLDKTKFRVLVILGAILGFTTVIEEHNNIVVKAQNTPILTIPWATVGGPLGY